MGVGALLGVLQGVLTVGKFDWLMQSSQHHRTATGSAQNTSRGSPDRHASASDQKHVGARRSEGLLSRLMAMGESISGGALGVFKYG